MMPKNYTVNVDGIGTFTFRPTWPMGVKMQVFCEFNRLTQGQDNISEWLSSTCNMLATLKVATISAPEGWDLDEMDALDEDACRKLIAVFDALQEREFFFRGERRGNQGQGKAGPAQDPMVVQEPLQPADT